MYVNWMFIILSGVNFLYVYRFCIIVTICVYGLPREEIKIEWVNECYLLCILFVKALGVVVVILMWAVKRFYCRWTSCVSELSFERNWFGRYPVSCKDDNSYCRCHVVSVEKNSCKCRKYFCVDRLFLMCGLLGYDCVLIPVDDYAVLFCL